MAVSSKVYRVSESGMQHACPVGIISLEENIPCPPGTPGNPETFTYPVLYEIVRGANVLDTSDPTGLQLFLDAGRRLVERGACAVAGNCGLMIVYQEQLASALPVPVLLSSLLQLPYIAGMYGPRSAIGIIASSSRSLQAEHLRFASPEVQARIVLASMEGKRHFREAMTGLDGDLNFEAVQTEVVMVAEELVTQHPHVSALLLECVDLPPYAAAVQAAVGKPVFDITTLMNHVQSSLARMPFGRMLPAAPVVLIEDHEVARS